MILRAGWSNCFVVLITSYIAIVLRLLSALSCRIWRLIACAIVDRVDSIALKGRDLEIYAAKLYYVTNSHHLLLIVGKEVFKDLIN